jgi:multiple sugar transport system substrate-binding protein
MNVTLDGRKGGMTRRSAVFSVGASLTGVVGAGALAACGAEQKPAVSTEPVSLLMVNWGAIPQGWNTIGDAFTKENPRITVQYSPVEAGTWGGYFEKLSVMSAGGQPPDLARVALEGVQLVANQGMAVPLDPFMKRDQAELKDYFPDVNQNMLKSMGFQGKQYQLPFTWNGPVIHYNTTLFERAGIARPKDDWTTDNFIDVAKRLTRDDVWGVATPNAYWGGVIPWLFLAGTDLLSDDWKQSRANDSKTVDAVQFYQELSSKHRVAPPNGAGADFNTGKLAMRMDGGGNHRLNMMNAGMKDFDILPFPKWRTQTHEYGGTGFPIMKGSKHEAEAWQLNKYLIRKESIALFCASVSQTPARRSVAYDMWVKQGEPPKNYKLYFDVLDKLAGAGQARAVPAPPEFNEIETMTLKYLKQVTANEVNAKSAMDNLHRELSELLAKRPPAKA